MAKDYAVKFYKSAAWQRARDLCLDRSCWICERCLEEFRDHKRSMEHVNLADVVHHRKYITPRNIGLSSITLNQDNLEALCDEHHNREHHGTPQRYGFDAEGNIICRE